MPIETFIYPTRDDAREAAVAAGYDLDDVTVTVGSGVGALYGYWLEGEDDGAGADLADQEPQKPTATEYVPGLIVALRSCPPEEAHELAARIAAYIGKSVLLLDEDTGRKVDAISPADNPHDAGNEAVTLETVG